MPEFKANVVAYYVSPERSVLVGRQEVCLSPDPHYVLCNALFHSTALKVFCKDEDPFDVKVVGFIGKETISVVTRVDQTDGDKRDVYGNNDIQHCIYGEFFRNVVTRSTLVRMPLVQVGYYVVGLTNDEHLAVLYRDRVLCGGQ